MTKEQDFKIRLAALLKDLQDAGSQDGEAMFLLGSLASDLADDLESPSWTIAKQSMTPYMRDTLLRTFEEQGNRHNREDRLKQAYAIQILVSSLIAGMLRADPVLAQGELLLDQIIDHTERTYRQQKRRTN